MDCARGNLIRIHLDDMKNILNFDKQCEDGDFDFE